MIRKIILLLTDILLIIGCSVQRHTTIDNIASYIYVRPEWFGAKNDGITDCTSSIQRMFDYMAKNGVYICKFRKCDFGKGEFYLISNTINIRKPVKIEGRKAYISTKSLINLGNDSKKWFYRSDGIAFNFVGGKENESKLTDICINLKVHAKPFFFDRMKNVYVHDCYVSTYTGDTLVTKGDHTNWFAFQCIDLIKARFKNVYIDQPTSGLKYNSADGIHLSGGCHDILIENVNGQSGDDFIAMNASENNSGDIYNITINNCQIGKNRVSGAGVRFYGCSRLSIAPGKPQLKIYNVKIENCYINTNLSPCIFFTNNPDWRHTDKNSHKLKISGVYIKNCDLFFKSIKKEAVSTIWIDGVECNELVFNKVNSSDEGRGRQFIQVMNFVDYYSVRVQDSYYNGEKVELNEEDLRIKQ